MLTLIFFVFFFLEVLLFEQKALKIEREFSAEKKIESDINKAIAEYQHKLICLNETLVGKKDYKENLGKENTLVQTQFLKSLKVFVNPKFDLPFFLFFFFC